MNLSDAMQILKKNGFICEHVVGKKYILVDKQRNDDDPDYEDDYKYVDIFGPATWEKLEAFVKKWCTKDISEIPVDPIDEPEEGFIITSV